MSYYSCKPKLFMKIKKPLIIRTSIKFSNNVSLLIKTWRRFHCDSFRTTSGISPECEVKSRGDCKCSATAQYFGNAPVFSRCYRPTPKWRWLTFLKRNFYLVATSSSDGLAGTGDSNCSPRTGAAVCSGDTG